MDTDPWMPTDDGEKVSQHPTALGRALESSTGFEQIGPMIDENKKWNINITHSIMLRNQCEEEKRCSIPLL